MNDLKPEQPQEITLLVLERGAVWPSWVTDLRDRANHSLVEVQAVEEADEAFERRMLARIERLSQRNSSLVAAAYVCTASACTRLDGRRRICEALIGRLQKTGMPELILAAGDWNASSPERFQLIALWGELSQRVAHATVSVRFDEGPNKSGVFRAASRPPQSRSDFPRIKEEPQLGKFESAG